MKTVHGIARLSSDGKTLTLITKVKKGKKVVEKHESYQLSDAEPDPEVAFPVVALTKKDGTVYHCGVNEWGPFCDCPNSLIREKYDVREHCKHLRGLIAHGIIKDTRRNDLPNSHPRLAPDPG